MVTPRESLRAPQLQDHYLAECKRQAVPVIVYLMNGFQLHGLVKGYDAFTIVLEYEKRAHLIYKHAVSTISPQGLLLGVMPAEEAAKT
jgi:host factor-I protein